MAIRRPILVIGVGLSFALWFWDSLSHSGTELGTTTFWSLLAMGAGVWWWQQQKTALPEMQGVPEPIGRETAEKAIAQTQAVITQLATEAQTDPQPQIESQIATLQAQVSQLTSGLDRQNLNVELIGTKTVGKTTLIQQLQTCLSETKTPLPALNFQETLWHTVTATEPVAVETDSLQVQSDLILFVITGDLTDSEYQMLNQLKQKSRRFMLVWNKQDHYLPEQQTQILQRLRQTVHQILEPEDVVAVSCSPNPIKVRKHQENGVVEEWVEKQQPEISTLAERFGQIVARETQSLIWSTTILEARQLQEQTKVILNELRKTRALPIIENYQWIAAAAAFANPVPALDLLAMAAINAQLVVDLGAIYQQKFSLEQGKTVAGTLATQMLKLGLVELSTKMISALLKTNAVTFAVGGVVQGVSAAYFTRMAGLSLIEYFQAQELPLNPNAVNGNDLGKTLHKIFQQNQQVGFLQGFVQKVLGHLMPESREPKVC